MRGGRVTLAANEKSRVKKMGGESGGRESHVREVKVGLLWRSM